MSKLIFDPFSLSGLRRFCQFVLFVCKWFIRFNAATLELYLHHNFGRRYLVMLAGGILTFVFCGSFAPNPSTPSNLFLLGLIALFSKHSIQALSGPRRGLSPPHSHSNGQPWDLWLRLGFSRLAFERYWEPLLCFLVSIPLINYNWDLFLGFWIRAAAVSLFLKGQMDRIRFNRRVLDALDAKHEAQRLNAALKAKQHASNQSSARPHRARLIHNLKTRP